MKSPKTTKKMVEAVVLGSYRNAASSWAGGDTGVSVTLVGAARVAADGWSDRVWSSNGKWSGLDANYSVAVQKTWSALPDGIRTAGGMLTLSARRVRNKPGLWSAKWCRQGRGFEMVVETGVILEAAGEYYHAANEKAARRLVAKRERAGRRSARWVELTEMSAAAITSRYGDCIVTLRDSVAAGNCRSGSQQWQSQHCRDGQPVRVADLAAHFDQPRVRRSAYRAILRATK